MYLDFWIYSRNFFGNNSVKLTSTTFGQWSSVEISGIFLPLRFYVHSVEISGFFYHSNLREINFGKTRGSKTAIFALFGALNFCLSLLKIQKVVKIQNHTLSMWKMADFDTLDTVVAKKRKTTLNILRRSWKTILL